MNLDSVFNQYFPLVGKYGGDTFNVYRPNYSVVDNSPVLVSSNKKFRTDPVSKKFAEPSFTNVGWYDIFGDRSLLQAGDILKKSTSDGMTPAVTIAHFMPMKAITGFRTSRIGKITNNIDENIYTNVYFDFLDIGFPGSSLTKQLEDSLRIPNTRVVLYRRVNIDILRMHLVETDDSHTVNLPGGSTGAFTRYWTINQIDQSGNIMILTISNK